MESIIKQIADNTAPKSSTSIAISDNKTNFVTKFSPPLELDKHKSYEIALVNLETYYSFPNIDAERNSFKYSPNDEVDWYDFTLPIGCYTIEDINAAVQQRINKNGHDEKAITISANSITLKTIIKVATGYSVDFFQQNSLGKVLGFKKDKYTGYNESENLVNILNVNTILVNADIISGSYVDGVKSSAIYSFFPNVDPGYKIIEKPNHPIYLPVHVKTIPSIRTTITDQTGKLLDLRGECVTIRYHLREI